MQSIAKAVLIVCATYLAVHYQDMRFLYLYILVLLNWD